MLDLTRAALVVPAGWDGPRLQAAHVLAEEVQSRSGLRWPVLHARPAGGPAVVLAEAPDGGPGPEGYRLAVRDQAVQVAAADARGVLFAVGHLLRRLRLGPGRADVAGDLEIETAPRYPLRGHQLGYRPKNNTYDAWSPAQFERYIRDLALFGANFIELLPPRTDDADHNALMRLPKEDLLAAVMATLERYGLGAGLWYPLMAHDYADPGTAAAELAAADGVFGLCAALEAVFVPGGDPGHTPPGVLLPFLERLAAVLRRRHPGAGLWVSPQGFTPAALAEFCRLLRERPHPYLAGVVYGPWTACTLPELRQALPEGCPLRLYPDIAHTISCQYPAVNWDPAFAETLGREPINPRPRAQAAIVRALAPGTVGFVSYSEGVNDDVNKFVWTALGWDPEADLGAVLRDYARLLVAPAQADAVAQGILALERNWDGPLLTNAAVPRTLGQWQAIERAAGPRVPENWRLASLLYRGYYDGLVQRRLVAATAAAGRAKDLIAQGREGALPADVAVAAARAALASAEQPAHPWRVRLDALADQLFAGIGLQLSVSRHGASGLERGANLDAVDAPLGDGPALAAALEGIAALPDAGRRAAALAAFDPEHGPGPGGFLDDLGRPGAQDHLEGGMAAVDDPDFQRSVLMVPAPAARPGQAPLPQLYRTAAETLYGQPLVLAYRDLDPEARYTVRVLYHGRYRAAVSLRAGGLEIHGPLRPAEPPAPMAFAVPPEATGDGRLVLTWQLVEGRGIQVAAVWLERADAADGSGAGPSAG